MWIVRLALERPYTFVVMALMILFIGGFSIFRMSTDIFPSIDIPVVSVVWSLTGLSPSEMEKRIVTISERAMTTTVNDIEHIESQSLRGAAVIKVFFHPDVKIEAAVAEVTAICQTVVRLLPPGVTPPFVMRYNAATVSILQLGVGSKTIPEQALFDISLNTIKIQLATVQGAQIPAPYGGKARQIQVDLDLKKLQGYGVTPLEVSNAINNYNLILPAGTVKLDDHEYTVALTTSPERVDDLNNVPIRAKNGAIVHVGDVAHVRDGFAVQTNIVHVNGVRAALMLILKAGKASTLDVVRRVKGALPRIQSTCPPDLELVYLLDQSIFVRAAIGGVVREGVMAGLLTALMILLFLGSWRSTLIVATSIPLAILTSIALLAYFGETLNIMTLGGLSLAVGILVDDATVEVENIHRNHAMGKGLIRAILDGASQIAVPTFVSTLSICIVFVSVIFLTGPAKYLFTPMAMAVCFAMMASYMLSRTVVPIMAHYLLSREGQHSGPIWRIHYAFDRRFEAFRAFYMRQLEWGLANRRMLVGAFSALFVASLGLIPVVGEDFFPSVDAGSFRFHVRAPAGTRLEETERLIADVQREIRQVIPAEKLSRVLDTVGLASTGVNLVFADSINIGPAEGEIIVVLHEGHKAKPYIRALRRHFREKFPQLVFYFTPSDIVNQILNFGLPAPIDIQVIGRDKRNLEVARSIEQQLARVPGAVDVHIHQLVDSPELRFTADTDRAQLMGISNKDIASSLLISLASSGQAAPNYWIDPRNGVSYLIAVQAPIQKLAKLADLLAIPVGGRGFQQLNNVATMKRSFISENISHYDVQPTYNVYAGVDGIDLGRLAKQVDKIVKEASKDLPRGTQIKVRGQALSMKQSFHGLFLGMAFAILLVYMLMVVNFQSWVDPFIILMALPGALSGAVWMLYLTQTTFSVPSLMGCIMCIGVATANSILMVTFANERRHSGDDAMTAAHAAGFTRLRPVCMTALAMIIGMLPMALGFGEGGEQNAPLGIAVIGGLILATFTTLLLVPVMYTYLRRRAPFESNLDEIMEREAGPHG